MLGALWEPTAVKSDRTNRTEIYTCKVKHKKNDGQEERQHVVISFNLSQNMMCRWSRNFMNNEAIINSKLTTNPPTMVSNSKANNKSR